MSKTPLFGVPLIKGARDRSATMDDANVSPSPATTLGERLAVLEQSARETSKRLGEGAETFGQIRSALEKVTGRWSQELEAVRVEVHERAKGIEGKLDELRPRPASRMQLFGALFGAVVFVGTLIWWASRYPERGEFREISSAVQANATAIHDLVRDQDLIRRRLDALEARKP